MTTSTLQLIKYLEKTKCKKILDEITNSNSEELYVDVETFDTIDNELSPAVISFAKQSKFLMEEFPIDLLMNVWNLAGIGFEESGRILYTSRNLLNRLGLIEPIVGEDIKVILSHDSKRILDRVFKCKILRWVGYIDVQKPSGKEAVSILWNGKLLTDSNGNKMYLGYLEMKDAIYYNPGGIFWNKEVLVSADFTLLTRHFYIDQLLGYDKFDADDIFAHVHPMDLIQLQDLDKRLLEHGYSEHVFRLLCKSESADDVRWLITLTKMYPFQTQSGDMILVTYSWPFAFSKSNDCLQDKSIVDHLEFIQSNDAWLSLMPSFMTNSTSPSQKLD